MDTTINKFSFSRVAKLLKLDWSSNRGTILTGITIGFVVLLIPILLMIVSGDFSDLRANISIYSLFGNLYILIPVISILFMIIVFKRSNRNSPMHISLIPATNKEKYVAFFIEWIIKQVTIFLIFIITLLGIMIAYREEINYVDISQGIDTIRHYIGSAMKLTGDGILPILNMIAVLYIILMSVLSDFTIISMACIGFRKGWQVVLFLVLFQFIVLPMLFSITFSAMPYLMEDFTIEKVNLFLNVAMYSSIILTTAINVIFAVIGYRQLKKKQNIN